MRSEMRMGMRSCSPSVRTMYRRQNIFALAELDLIPGNAKRRMAGTKRQEYGKIKRIPGGDHADHTAVVSAEAQIHAIEKWPNCIGFTVRFGDRGEFSCQLMPTAYDADRDQDETPANRNKYGKNGQ